MRVRRFLAAACLVVVATSAACGSGSGTAEDQRRGVPPGPDDAGTTGNDEPSNGGTGPGENQPLIPPETGGDE